MPAHYPPSAETALSSAPPAAALTFDDGQIRTDVALKRLFRWQLSEMKTHTEGIQQDTDNENLHQFRIAVRKTRTLLTEIKSVLPPRYEALFRREFAWLGQDTGRGRDLDVYLDSFDTIAALAGSKRRGALEPLRAHIAEQRALEHARVVDTLDGARYTALLESWTSYLEQPVPQHVGPLNAMRPIGAVAREHIARTYRRAEHLASNLSPRAEAEAFHDLRKVCKKERYLFEFFQGLLPNARLGKVLKIMKALQEELGLFQDLEVQQKHLRAFSADLAPASRNDDYERAFARVLRSLEKREAKMRGRCIVAWRNFAAAGAHKSFKKHILTR